MNITLCTLHYAHWTNHLQLRKLHHALSTLNCAYCNMYIKKSIEMWLFFWTCPCCLGFPHAISEKVRYHCILPFSYISCHLQNFTTSKIVFGWNLPWRQVFPSNPDHNSRSSDTLFIYFMRQIVKQNCHLVIYNLSHKIQTLL